MLYGIYISALHPHLQCVIPSKKTTRKCRHIGEGYCANYCGALRHLSRWDWCDGRAGVERNMRNIDRTHRKRQTRAHCTPTNQKFAKKKLSFPILPVFNKKIVHFSYFIITFAP